MDIFIYKLSDPADNAVRYVGKSNDLRRRLNQHYFRRANQGLWRWLAALAATGARPKMEPIETCSEADWRERETYWIARYRAAGADLFNIADGGDGITTHDEAVRRFLSRLHRGKKLAPEHARRLIEAGQTACQTAAARAKRAATLRGRPSPLRGRSIHSAETRRRIAQKQRGRVVGAQTREKLRIANLGRRMAPEVRARMSAAHLGRTGPNKGRVFSPEWRAHLGEAHRGRKLDPEFGRKMSLILRGRPKSPEHIRRMSEVRKGKPLCARTLARAAEATRAKWASDPEFRERKLAGLRPTWNDPEVKRKAAEATRRRLMPIRRLFAAWLVTAPELRVPPTQAGFERAHHVSESALLKWKKDPEFQAMVAALRAGLELNNKVTNKEGQEQHQS